MLYVHAYRDLMKNRSPACGLSEYCDTIRIAAEQVNVLLDPIQSQPLIVETKVCSAVLLESGTAEETECTKSVIH